MNGYAEGVTQFVTQGALRDPGLWSVTPSAFIRSARAPSSPNPQSAIRYPQSRGLSLMEVIASTLIVGVMAVAALNALGAATHSATMTGNRAIALGLADELMAEILQAHYREPDTTPVFGPEPHEVGGPREVFNDVDDYHGWLEQPPESAGGTPLADRNGWRRWVEVYYVNREDPLQTTGPNGDQGVKRIRVVVEYQGQVLAEQHGLRTDW